MHVIWEFHTAERSNKIITIKTDDFSNEWEIRYFFVQNKIQ